MLPEVLLLSPGFLFLKAPFPLLLMSCLLKIKKFFRYLSNRTAISHLHGLPWWFNSKKKISVCQGRRYRRLAFYPWGQEDSSGGGNANPLWYSCLGNPMDRATWWATPSIRSQRVGHDLVTPQQQSLLHTNDFHSKSPFISPICSSKSNKVSLDTQLQQLVILCYWAQYSVL